MKIISDPQLGLIPGYDPDPNAGNYSEPGDKPKESWWDKVKVGVLDPWADYFGGRVGAALQPPSAAVSLYQARDVLIPIGIGLVGALILVKMAK